MFLTRNNSAYFKLEPRKQKEVQVKEGEEEESVKKEDKENKEDDEQQKKQKVNKK